MHDAQRVGNGPASGQQAAETDPVARVLLPALLHKLNNATQLLSGLNSLLAMPGGDTFVFSRKDDFARASLSVEELGWVLAVIGSASGSNMLLDRREPRGLEIMVELTLEAIRRTGTTVAAAPALPLLAPAALDGWQVPWAIASALIALAQGQQAGQAATWTFERSSAGAFVWQATPTPQLEALQPLMLERLPGARCTATSTAWELELPGAWFQETE